MLENMRTYVLFSKSPLKGCSLSLRNFHFTSTWREMQLNQPVYAFNLKQGLGERGCIYKVTVAEHKSNLVHRSNQSYSQNLQCSRDSQRRIRG